MGPADRARGAPGSAAVGKRTLTMDLPVVPPKATQPDGAVAAEAVQQKTAGSPLATDVRSKVEPAYGNDLSDVRVHDDPTAHSASAALSARAFAHGRDVFLGRGESPSDTRLIAHEVAHVVQQSDRHTAAPQAKLTVGAVDDPLEKEADHVADAIAAGAPPERIPAVSRGAEPVIRRQPAEGPVDAGVPLPAGVVDPSPRPAAASLGDYELGSELEHAEELAKSGSPDRENEIEDELEKRVVRTSFATAPGGSPGTPGNTQVTSDVAVQILENVAKGEPPFKPELGKGGASWFVTEGNPYTSIDPAKNVSIDVEIAKSSKPVRFAEPELLKLLEETANETAGEAEAAFRQRFGIEASTPLTSKLGKSLSRFKQQFAESRMWDKVGQRVRASADGVGEVVLQAGSRFSRSGSGKFAVVTDAAKIQVKGGVEGLVQRLASEGVSAEPPLLEAAEALAKQARWAGRVRGVFRYGGRILIVVGIAADVWKIYHAQDKVKAVVESVGGWAGATAGAAAFAAWFAPGDVAGPWAWAAHGVGTLIAGGVGYWAGSTTTRTIYELAVEN
jgi:hypothetical protein